MQEGNNRDTGGNNRAGKEGNNLKNKGKRSKHASQETSRVLRETKLVRRKRNLTLGSGTNSTPGTGKSANARRRTELCPLYFGQCLVWYTLFISNGLILNWPCKEINPLLDGS